MYYWLNETYNVMEIVVEDGQKIPKPNDKILVHQHDETGSKIEFEAFICEIIERKIVNNQLILLIKYNKT